MKHEKRRFAEKIDYVTSPGWIDGPDGRAKIGLIPDKGPRAVITELGIMRFGEDRRMYLAEYFPGVTPEQIADKTGFAMDVSRAVESEAPDSYVLETLIRKVDPMRLMT
jgi:glutaconate CoA-transferase subunit B